MLMEEAERIAREEHGSVKLAVISGVGTRHYYAKLGYHLENTYMVKMLKKVDEGDDSDYDDEDDDYWNTRDIASKERA